MCSTRTPSILAIIVIIVFLIKDLSEPDHKPHFGYERVHFYHNSLLVEITFKKKSI